MAKIDDILESISAGYSNPTVQFGHAMIEDKFMDKDPVKVRRKQTGVTHHKLTYLCVGELGQAPAATFYGHKLTDCIKKALAWRGLPTTSKGKNAAPAQQQG